MKYLTKFVKKVAKMNQCLFNEQKLNVKLYISEITS